jgi:subtilisin family serine protease
VLATAHLASGGPGAGHVVGLTVSPSGDRVLLAQQHGSATVLPRAILTSLGMDLRLLSQVALTDELTASRPLQLAADEAGTAYVTLAGNEEDNAEVRLVAVPAAATAVTPVATFDQIDDVTALAVDRAGLWGYVGGLASPSDPLSPTITPVDLRTGKARFPVTICERGELTDIAVPATGDGLLVTGRCADTGFRPTVWTLR